MGNQLKNNMKGLNMDSTMVTVTLQNSFSATCKSMELCWIHLRQYNREKEKQTKPCITKGHIAYSHRHH